jgi:hypothetical protein
MVRSHKIQLKDIIENLKRRKPKNLKEKSKKTIRFSKNRSLKIKKSNSKMELAQWLYTRNVKEIRTGVPNNKNLKKHELIDYIIHNEKLSSYWKNMSKR